MKLPQLRRNRGTGAAPGPAPPIVPPPTRGNSRGGAELAGWRKGDGQRPYWWDLLDRRKRNRWGNFTWISPAPLLASVNDQIVKGMDDLINAIRARWVAAQRCCALRDEGPTIDLEELGDEFSFLILGDPGEQDASQYAVVKPLLAKGGDTDFMIIDSDVIYPAGDINDYVDGFYLPYRKYKAPIYAIPGNHDWYDGLNGFMWHFCDAEPLPPVKYRAGGFSWKERLARVLWRKPTPPKLPELLHERCQLSEERRNARQPGPYFAIKTERLLIVCIDTGITGVIDREQGEWLRSVSCLPGPKVLITGKPIYVDAAYEPGKIDWGPEGDEEIREETRRFRTVDDIVREKDHGYKAVIGGDIHNYQRYSVGVRDRDDGSPCNEEPREPSRRLLHYLVAGGGGAYLSATHRIGRVDLEPEDERGRIPVDRIKEETNFWCYPLRGDSLARFVQRFSIGFGVALLTALAIVAAAMIYLWYLDGFNQGIEKFDAVLGKVLGVVLGTVIVAPLTIAAGVFVSNRFVSSGYRTMTATTLTVALGGLLVWGANEVLLDWDNMAWKMSLATLMAVAVPVAGVVGYYLLRDFIAPSLRVAIALAIPLGLAVVTIVSRVEAEEASVVVGLSLLALWLGVALIAYLRGADAVTQKKRLRAGRLLALALAGGGVIWALILVRDDSWIPVGLLIGLGAVLTLAAAILIILGWRGIRALRWLFPGRIDPDETARWLARELDMVPVRASAMDARPGLRTKALASLVYKTRFLGGAISVLAEATRPPFFKSFLRVDLNQSALKITAYGVTGHAEDETTPTVEDEVTIPLP
jgi:hypothetical protein